MSTWVLDGKDVDIPEGRVHLHELVLQTNVFGIAVQVDEHLQTEV